MYPKSCPRRNDSEGMQHNPGIQKWNLTFRCSLVSYPGHSLHIYIYIYIYINKYNCTILFIRALKVF